MDKLPTRHLTQLRRPKRNGYGCALSKLAKKRISQFLTSVDMSIKTGGVLTPAVVQASFHSSSGITILSCYSAINAMYISKVRNIQLTGMEYG